MIDTKNLRVGIGIADVVSKEIAFQLLDELDNMYAEQKNRIAFTKDEMHDLLTGLLPYETIRALLDPLYSVE